jgi:hypothetical protein
MRHNSIRTLKLVSWASAGLLAVTTLFSVTHLRAKRTEQSPSSRETIRKAYLAERRRKLTRRMDGSGARLCRRSYRQDCRRRCWSGGPTSARPSRTLWLRTPTSVSLRHSSSRKSRFSVLEWGMGAQQLPRVEYLGHSRGRKLRGKRDSADF